MPENWKTYTLGEITLTANTGLDAIKRAPIVNEDTGIKCLRIQDVSQVKEYDNWGFCKVSDDNYKRFALKQGEIIIARTGNTIGVNMFIKEDINSVFNNGLIRVRVNKDLTYPKYLYYIFRSNSFKNYIQAIAFGTSTQPNMQIGSLLNYDLILPPLPEQKAIASILSALDDKIENNLAMNKTLEDMAMALYKHWFIDFGPFKECKFVDSELGLIPEGWKVKQIKEIATVNSKSIKKGTAPERITYIDIASANIGWVSEVESMHFSDAPSRARRIIDDGDIVWSTVRPNRKSRFLSLGFQKDTIVSTGFAVISPKIVPYSYLYPHCCTNDFTDYLVSRATGSSYPAVTGKIFEEALILYPPELILSNYDKLAKPYYQSFASNNIENQTLTQLRDTLLPKLISGEVRLKEFEEEITAAL